MPLLKLTNKDPKTELKMFHGVQLITLPKSNIQKNVALVKTDKTKLAWTKNNDPKSNKPKLNLLIGTKPIKTNKNELAQETCPKLLQASVPTKPKQVVSKPSLSTPVYRENDFNELSNHNDMISNNYQVQTQHINKTTASSQPSKPPPRLQMLTNVTHSYQNRAPAAQVNHFNRVPKLIDPREVLSYHNKKYGQYLNLQVCANVIIFVYQFYLNIC